MLSLRLSKHPRLQNLRFCCKSTGYFSFAKVARRFAALHSLRLTKPPVLYAVRTNPTLTKPKVLYACSASLANLRFAGSRRFASTAKLCKSPICLHSFALQNRRFCTQPCVQTLRAACSASYSATRSRSKQVKPTAYKTSGFVRSYVRQPCVQTLRAACSASLSKQVKPTAYKTSGFVRSYLHSKAVQRQQNPHEQKRS